MASSVPILPTLQPRCKVLPSKSTGKLAFAKSPTLGCGSMMDLSWRTVVSRVAWLRAQVQNCMLTNQYVPLQLTSRHVLSKHRLSCILHMGYRCRIETIHPELKQRTHNSIGRESPTITVSELTQAVCAAHIAHCRRLQAGL